MRSTKLTVFLIIACSCSALATITPGNFACAAQSTAATKSVTVTNTINTGDSAFVLVVLNGTTDTVSSVTDTGGSSYSQKVTCGATCTTVDMEIWATNPGAAVSSVSVTANWGASNAKGVACVGTYTGVLAYGNTGTPASGTCATCSINTTTQDNNNYAFAGFGGADTNTWTANVGNLRAQAQTTTSAAANAAIADNTAASPGTVTNTLTITSAIHARISLELRTVAPSTSGHNSMLPGMGVGE